MVPTGSRDAIYTSLGIRVSELDMSRGVLAIRTLNCTIDKTAGRFGVRASGVVVEPVGGSVDGSAIPFRLSNNNLATGATLETDERGVAGFVNLAAQSIDVIAKAPYGREYGGPTTLLVRPMVITLAELRDGLDVWGQ
jgi:hypothetical protein